MDKKFVPILFALLLLTLEVSATLDCDTPNLCLSASFMRGISTGTYMDKNFVPSEELDEMYDRFVTDNMSWVSLEVSWYQENNTSNEIERMGDTWDESVPGLTWSDEDLICLINLAHTKKLKVVLRPRVHCYYWNEGCWTGNISPSDPEKWFQSFRSFLSYYAEIAQKYGVDLLCIGTEMYGIVREESQWRNTISYVREIYKGPITYSDCISWNLNAWKEILWADELDYIGVNLYKNLTTKTDPTIEELKNALEKIFDDELKPLYTRWNKPIILIEFGYRNVDGANAYPDPDYVNEIDDQEVADIYNALFYNLVKNPSLIVGLFPWVFSHKSRSNFLVEDSGITFEIREKPAEEVIKAWYSRPPCQQYFFFNDGDLLISEDCKTHYWEIGLNPNNEQTYGYISNGLAYLSLNESGGSEWGWASFSQGDCPWRVYPDMLRGYCYDTAQPIPYSEGVEFTRKHIPQEGKYFLTAKVYYDEREYVHDVEDDDPKCNIGIVFYCSYKVNGVEFPYFGEYDGNDNNFTAIDIYLSSSFWNGATFEPINYVHIKNRTNGYTIGLTISNQLQDEDMWREYEVDMNWVLTQTFQSLPDNIDSLKIRATQFYVEGSGTLISARFDHSQMILKYISGRESLYALLIISFIAILVVFYLIYYISKH